MMKSSCKCLISKVRLSVMNLIEQIFDDFNVHSSNFVLVLDGVEF